MINCIALVVINLVLFLYNDYFLTLLTFMKLWIIVMCPQEGELRLCASPVEGRVMGGVVWPGSGSRSDSDIREKKWIRTHSQEIAGSGSNPQKTTRIRPNTDMKVKIIDILIIYLTFVNESSEIGKVDFRGMLNLDIQTWSGSDLLLKPVSVFIQNTRIRNPGWRRGRSPAWRTLRACPWWTCWIRPASLQ